MSRNVEHARRLIRDTTKAVRLCKACGKPGCKGHANAGAPAAAPVSNGTQTRKVCV